MDPPQSLVDVARRVRDWLLLEAHRAVVATGFLGVAFAVFSWLDLTAVLHPAENPTPMLWLFSSLAGGNFTLVSIVIAINQLVLTREFRSPRELLSEFNAAEDYRGSVREDLGMDAVSEQPHDFLQVLTTSTRRRASNFETTVDDCSPELHDELRELRRNVLDDLDRPVREFQRPSRRMLPALLSMLDTDFSSLITHSRWIRETYADDVSDQLRDALLDLENDLEHLDVGRQYLRRSPSRRSSRGCPSRSFTSASSPSSCRSLSSSTRATSRRSPRSSA